MQRMHKWRTVVPVLCLMVFSIGARPGAAESSAEELPVREVTVFKDGHAFILQQGRMPTDTDGHVTLRELPTPIVGTFWAFSSDSKAELTSVVSARQVMSVEKTALTIPELLKANTGARVHITEPDEKRYEAVILGIPARGLEDVHRSNRQNPQPPSQDGQIVLLRIGTTTKVLPIGRIQDVTFLDGMKSQTPLEEFRNTMTLRLDWKDRPPAKDAEVGMTYVERGIRWIPNYRVDIDGKGAARMKLQATLVNELLDLNNVTVHLVVGVPTFAFEETPDPISLQQTVAQLSTHMRQDSRTAYSFSNAIMSQSERSIPRGHDARTRVAIDLGPDVAASGKNEDLYVFTIDHITLEKGQRMVVPIADYELDYENLFVVDLPVAPPPEARQSFNTQQQAELARLFHGPRAEHKIRLKNDAEYPLTTAPALILRHGRVIAQSMMTYTAVGAACDLELTTAVDISVASIDRETGRTPNAAKIDGYNFTKTDLEGTVTINNRRSDSVKLEVRRSILGHLEEVNHDGHIEQLGGHDTIWMADYGRPFWWDWYRWPYWWHHLNGFGRVTWQCGLAPAESIELKYQWNYFWRR
mgnify:CR=1 FL=1